jgi:hypothetical protein
MKRRKWLLLLGALLCALLVTGGLALASATYDVHWNVIGGGGGPASSGSYRLNGTLGQAGAGSGAGGNYRLSAGYWAGVVGAAAGPTPTKTPTIPWVVMSRTFLPIIRRQLYIP